MAPRVQALAQSESKAKFLARLGLDPEKPEDKDLYRSMKEEAIAGRNRMLNEPGILRDDSSQNAQLPPGNAQINETATHNQILEIYRGASPKTKEQYDKGHDTDGLEEENWVIRWLLWHVFRYRDNRNKNRRQASPNLRNHNSSERSSSENQNLAPQERDGAASAPKTGFYDPVRDN